MQLKEKELNQIEGGAFKLSKPTLALIGGGIAFVIGFVSGFLRPSSCSSGK